MLIRRYLFGAAVILACALGLTVALIPTDRGARAAAALERAQGSGAARARPTALARPSGARRAAGEDPHPLALGSGEPNPDSLEAEPTRFGRVRGLISDMDGDPVSGAVIVLRLESPEWVRRDAVSDERGEFSLDDVPVGTWRVEHETHRPPVWERMAGIAGTIEVLEGRETWVPVLLEGQRQLSGTLRMDLEGFALEGDQGFMIDLELRPAWDPDSTVARGSIHSFARPPWKAGPRAMLDPEDDDFRQRDAEQVPKEEPEWIAGAFRFENLRPGRYTLRIRLEDNEWITVRNEGEERLLHLYLEREVDLTHGDVELPPEQLDFWQDFVRTAMERE